MKTKTKPAVKQTIGLLVATFAFVALTFTFVLVQGEASVARVNFSLNDTAGQEITHQDLGGRWLLVYFGFTSCADICPTQTAGIASTLQLLDDEGLAAKVTPVFISVDHIRDTPQRLQEYTSRFDPRILALSGTPAQLDRVTRTFDTHYELRELNSARQPAIDVVHSSMTYIVDPFGRIVDRLGFGHDPRYLAEHLAALM